MVKIRKIAFICNQLLDIHLIQQRLSLQNMDTVTLSKLTVSCAGEGAAKSIFSNTLWSTYKICIFNYDDAICHLIVL